MTEFFILSSICEFLEFLTVIFLLAVVFNIIGFLDDFFRHCENTTDKDVLCEFKKSSIRTVILIIATVAIIAALYNLHVYTECIPNHPNIRGWHCSR